MKWCAFFPERNSRLRLRPVYWLRHRLERRAITTRPSVASPGVDDWTETDPGLQHAIAALRSADREILLLAAWEGLDGAELAAALEITPAAAHQRLHRARARLQRRLDRTGAPE